MDILFKTLKVIAMLICVFTPPIGWFIGGIWFYLANQKENDAFVEVVVERAVDTEFFKSYQSKVAKAEQDE